MLQVGGDSVLDQGAEAKGGASFLDLFWERTGRVGDALWVSDWGRWLRWWCRFPRRARFGGGSRGSDLDVVGVHCLRGVSRWRC